MGLDITAYRNARKVEGVEVDSDGYPKDYDRFDLITGSEIDYTEKNFPGRTSGIVAGIYEAEDSFGFRAGSYGGYNSWRNQLAQVAGFRGDHDVWDNHSEGPFVELINFSDCEGIIGPKVSAKLAKDFADHADKAGDGYFRDKYDEWRKAFEMASDGGYVDFH